MAGVALQILLRQQAASQDLQARILPTFDATDHRADVIVPHGDQIACRQRRAVAAGAVEDDRLVAVHRHILFHVQLEKTSRNQIGTGDVPVHHLVPLAHVDDMLNLTGLQSPPDLVGCDLLDRFLDFFEKLARCESHSAFSRSGFVFWDE